MNGSITLAGVAMLVYLITMIMVVFTLADPIDAVVEQIGGIDAPDAQTELNTYIPLYRQAITLALVIGIATPFVVFIFWVFNRETIQQYR